MTRNNTMILALRVIAATAEKLADDLQAGRLWEGEASDAIGQIRKAVSDLPVGRQ